MKKIMLDTVIDSKRTDNLSNEDCKKWWDKFVTKNSYFTKFSFGLSRPELYAKIPLDKNSYILEIGIGYSRQLGAFCQISDNVYGIDVAKGAIDYAKQNAPKANVQEYDGEHIPFPDNTFDFVTSVFVLQHVSKSNAENLLKETMRVLKPGGIFLHEFLGGNWIAGEGNEHYSGGLTGMYNNGYSKEELETLGNKLGLKTLEMTIIDIPKAHNEEGTQNIWWRVQK